MERLVTEITSGMLLVKVYTDWLLAQEYETEMRTTPMCCREGGGVL